MKCPECKAEMFIDGFGGWRWTCIFCDHIDREATDKEIEDDMKEVEDELNRLNEEASDE